MKRCSISKISVFLLVIALFAVTGCCRSYSYNKYKSMAEEALRKRNFKKARELYSTIYRRENKPDGADKSRTTWAFYRLGVIAEILGDLRMAKGYYWGDKIDEGFYEEFPDTDWLAQAGWNWLDEGNQPRTLDVIFELEARGRPVEKTVTERKKREIVVPEKAETRRPDTFDIINSKPQRSFNRSLTPPPANAPQPFRVYH